MTANCAHVLTRQNCVDGSLGSDRLHYMQQSVHTVAGRRLNRSTVRVAAVAGSISFPVCGCVALAGRAQPTTLVLSVYWNLLCPCSLWGLCIWQIVA